MTENSKAQPNTVPVLHHRASVWLFGVLSGENYRKTGIYKFTWFQS